MKNFTTLFVLAATTAYLLLLYQPISTSSGSLPPLGPFLNPFDGFWRNAEDDAGRSDQDEQMVGIGAVATILFDDRAVPHVFTQSMSDQAFLQGYMHAKDRLWQMDMTSRQAAGRLSEVFGARVLEIDRRNRRIGMAHTADKHAENWKTCPEMDMLQRYIDGVNYFVENLNYRDYPLEYKLFNYQPEPWSLEKSALVMMSMNLVLCGRNEDVGHTNSLAMLGKEEYDFLFPDWNPKQSPIIPVDHQWDFEVERDTVVGEGKLVGYKFEQPSPPGIGSNNWAVHGSRTKSGSPILCSDPHLSLTLPSIWYEMHLVTENENVYGVTFPGIPKVIIGFNEHIAWGQTNVGMDVSDLYQIEWTDDNKDHYFLDGGKSAVVNRIEKIKVKGDADVVDTVKYTHWGPIVEDEDITLALHWLPNIEFGGCPSSTFSLLNDAKNFDDYLEALAYFESPAQNYVFASKNGDIAIKVQGKLPIKDVHQGKFIQDGQSTQNGWKGYIPNLQTPMVKNPERGFVSSANQHSAAPDYPYFYHGYYEDYRSRSLNDQLSKLDEVQLTDMQKLQSSTYSQYAADLCPLLINRLNQNDLSPNESNLFKILSDWDFNYGRDDEAPIYFDIWSKRLYNEIWDEFQGSDEDLVWPEKWRTIELMEKDSNHIYFDKKETTTRENSVSLIAESFKYTVKKYDSIQDETPQLSWQNYRPLTIPHLSRLPALSAKDVKTGGTASAINAISGNHAPSWRMIVELGDDIKAWGVYPGGSSGNPGSPYYKTGIDSWANGKYYPLHFNRLPTDFDESSKLSVHTIRP